MSITITLTPDQEQKLAELARQSGKDPSVYVHNMVTAHLNGAGPRGTRKLEFEADLPRLVTLFDQGRLVPSSGLASAFRRAAHGLKISTFLAKRQRRWVWGSSPT